MNSSKTIARIIGVLLLTGMIISILINQVLLGPVTFATDFLSGTATHSNQVIVSVILGIVNGVVGVSMAVILFPIFKKNHERLAFMYVAFSVVAFLITAIDNNSILSLLSLSREYVKLGAPDTDYLKTLGVLLYETRWWSHYMILLISFLPLSTFYILLYQSKLIPRFISVWGFIGALLLLLAILLAMFGQGTVMDLMIPIGLNQIFLSLWLLIKGFNSQSLIAEST